MLRFLQSLFGATYHPLNAIELSSSNLTHNYAHLLSQEKGMAVAPVLKSNAYGHGLVEIAKILDPLHAPFFCVDSLYEAYELYTAGIKTPILIMGYVHPDSLRVKKLPFWFVVYDTQMLSAIKKYQPHAPLHIFVDTGMHREGVPLKDLGDLLLQTRDLSLNIQGLLSHFAMADDSKSINTHNQIVNFSAAQKIAHDLGIFPKWVHLSASLGLLHAGEYQGQVGNVSRAGVALFGIDPEGKNVHLKPVLECTSTIVQVKEIAKGEKIGYDFTFTAKRNLKIAILPLGYNDGVDRRLSNVGCVSIGGVFCPIVGRVSMNITIVDVTHLASVHVGQKVVVYSLRTQDKNSILSASKLCKTIPYELLVHMTSSTRRVLVSD